MAQRRRAGLVVAGALAVAMLGACEDRKVPQPTGRAAEEGTGGSGRGPTGEGGTAGGGGIGSGASLNDRRPDLTGQDATQDVKAQPAGNSNEARQLEEARQPPRKIGEGARKPASAPGED